MQCPDGDAVGQTDSTGDEYPRTAQTYGQNTRLP